MGTTTPTGSPCVFWLASAYRLSSFWMQVPQRKEVQISESATHQHTLTLSNNLHVARHH